MLPTGSELRYENGELVETCSVCLFGRITILLLMMMMMP